MSQWTSVTTRQSPGGFTESSLRLAQVQLAGQAEVESWSSLSIQVWSVFWVFLLVSVYLTCKGRLIHFAPENLNI